MKKNVVASLAAAMVLGIAGTSFAAANPFVDVPAKHWSYESVTKLAQAGMVDGYGDGKFQGDKTISRYEMAQIVAKAMGKSDKADASQKAELAKLQEEFADELNKIGVRVEALEKKQPTVKISGNFLLRYTAMDYVNDDTKTNNTNAFYRMRLETQAIVDENTIFNTRFVTRDPMKVPFGKYGLPTCSASNKFGQEPTQSNQASFDRFNIVNKMGNVTVTAGRTPLVVGVTSVIADSGAFSFDGVKLAIPLGKVNAVVNHGRLVDRKDIDSLELSTVTGKLNYGVGHFKIQDNGSNVVAYNGTTSLGKDMLKLWYGNATYNFSDKLSLNGEFGQNKASYATENNKFYYLNAKLGDQVLNAKDKQNYSIQYWSVGKNALALDGEASGLSTLDTAPTNTKFTGWDFSYARAFSKNVSSNFHYVRVTDQSNSKNNFNYFRLNLISNF